MSNEDALLPTELEPRVNYRSRQLQATATLGASLLGSGILAQSKACESTGVVLFIFLSIGAIIIGHLSAVMLCESVFALAPSNPNVGYSDLVATVFGRKGELAILWAITVMQIGCCVGYVVVIGDIFTPLIAHWTNFAPNSAEVIYFFSLLVILPLTVFIRDLSSFKYTSAASVVIIFFFVGVVVANGIYVVASDNPNEKRQELIGIDEDLTGPYLWPKSATVFRSLPLVSFAYFMHFNVVPVLNTLRDLGSVEAKMSYIVASRLSFVLSGSFTMMFGLFGYLTFLSETNADILSNFRVTSTYISSFLNIVRALYGFALMLAYPIVIWEARENLKRIWFGGQDDALLSSSSDVMTIDSKKELRDSFRVHALLSAILVFITALIGSLVSDLNVVFGLIGSACTPVIGYIMPAALFIRCGAAEKEQMSVTAQIILYIGFFLVPFGLIIWFLDRFEIL